MKKDGQLAMRKIAVVLDGIYNSAYLRAHVQIRNADRERFNRNKAINVSILYFTSAQ